MTSKQIGMLAGAALAGALLLGTAGLVLAQDPSPSPTTSGSSGMMGGSSGMMGGSSGMMSGSSGMMSGSAGMMGSGSGMMSQAGHMNLTADQLKRMDALHEQMIATGTCDPAEMQQFHDQLQSGK